MKILLTFLIAASLYGQADISSATVRGTWDAGSAAVTAPFKIGTSDPASCTAAQRPFFYNTTSNLLKVCNATDTWTVVSGGSESTRCTVTATGDTITMFTGATTDDPCNVNFGSTVRAVTSSATFVLDGSSSGADTIRVQVLPAGTISVLIAAGATGTCTGCTDSVGTAFATDAVPIWEWTVTDDEFDVGGGTRRKADAGTKNVACGTGMSCSESGGTTTLSATSTGSDFATDMTYASWHWLPYGGQPVGGASNPGVYCNASVSGIAETHEIVAGEPARGFTWGTGGTPASGDYVTCIWGAGVNDPAAVTRWSDFISATNYKPFTLSQVMRVPTITNTIQRVGFWGTSVGASVTVDFVGLLLNTGVDSNWRCVVCTGGSCTPSGTTVAASTGVISVTVKSATTGTAECTIGATSMPVTTTLPTFASGVNPGFHTQTLTSASRSQTVFEAKLKVNR